MVTSVSVRPSVGIVSLIPMAVGAADSSVGTVTVNGTEAFRALGDPPPSPPSGVPNAFAASRPTLFVQNQRTTRRPPTFARS